MAKILRCNNFIPGCTFVATGKTSEEVFHRASEHVRVKHKFRGMSPEVIAVIHGAFVEDEPSGEHRAHARRGETSEFWRAMEKRA
jgi:predicted small metal-binding protein